MGKETWVWCGADCWLFGGSGKSLLSLGWGFPPWHKEPEPGPCFGTLTCWMQLSSKPRAHTELLSLGLSSEGPWRLSRRP